MFNKLYCVKQHDSNDCGVACLATICRQYGKNVSLTDIRRLTKTTVKGTSLLGIVKAAEKLDFCAKGVKTTKEALYTDIPLPCIAHVVVNGLLHHYVVIHKVTEKNIILADPGEGIVTLTMEEFLGEKNIPGTDKRYQWSGILALLIPDYSFEKGDKKDKTVLRLLKLIKKQWKTMMDVWIASLMITLFGIAGGLYFQFLLDHILGSDTYRGLLLLSAAFVVINIVKTVLGTFRSYLLAYLGQKLDVSLLFGYYKHLLKLPAEFFETRKTGDLLARFQDAQGVREAAAGTVVTVMIDSIMLLFGGWVLCLRSTEMFAGTVAAGGLYLLIMILFQRKYKKMNRSHMDLNGRASSFIVESIKGIQTIKTYNGESFFMEKMEGRFFRFIKNMFRLEQTINIQNLLMGLCEGIGEALILTWGALLVMKGRMTVGELVSYNVLMLYFLTPFKNMIRLQPQLDTALMAAERLYEILDMETEKEMQNEELVKAVKLSGDIEYKGVSFEYTHGIPVLRNVNMLIRTGEKIGIVGESGSGKSTLAKLLLKLERLEEGEIRIDGRNYEDVDTPSLRDRIAYISQDTFLFNGTVLENLTMGRSDLTLEKVIEVCQKTGAYEYINQMPKRFETEIQEDGSNLSGGQRQRLSITRALLKEPDIYVLDEATSNLDSIAEYKVNNAIGEGSRNKTMIIIAHRLCTVKDCDRIYVMDHGTIGEYGTHEELISRGGIYCELWEKQMKGQGADI